MVGSRARGRAVAVLGSLVVASLALGACSRGPGGAAVEDDPVVSAAPSTELIAPSPAATLPSGLPGDPGEPDPVITVPAGASLAPEVAAGDLDTVVFAAGAWEYLRCAGTGSPTVVIIPGLGVAHTAWSASVDALAQRTRTCVYDRPGVGLSPARTSPLQVVDAGLNARELATLLSIARQGRPYVLVGQGYGTLVARAFTRLYPAGVTSLVLAGSAPASAGGQVFWTEAGHRVDIAASTRAAGKVPAGTTALGVVVLPTDDPAAVTAAVPLPPR